jgi:hypothetical protein
MDEEELNLFLENLIGTRLAIRVASTYTVCIIKFELAGIMFSGGAHRSKVSNVMIDDRNVHLQNKDFDIGFQFEYKDVESIAKNDRENCVLHLIYRDGTDVTIYKGRIF